MKKIFILILSVLFPVVNSTLAGDATLRSISRAHSVSLNGLYIAGIDGMNNSFNNVAGLVYNNSMLLEFSVTDLIGQPELDNPTNGLYRSFQEDDAALSIGFIYPFSDGFVISVSYQRAYDYNVNWPFAVVTSTDSFSVFQAFDNFNRINIDAIIPSLALRFGDFSIGATFNVFNVKYKSAFPITNFEWNDTLGLPAYQFDYNMDAWSFGFNAGLMYELSEEFRLGAFVRSNFSADLEGESKSDLLSQIDSVSSQSKVTTTFEYPWVLGAGILYKLSSDWAVNLDFQYSLFENTNSFQMNFSDQGWKEKSFQIDPITGINPGNISTAFENTIDAGVGIEYSLTDWSFRGGYRFSQSQNSEASYNYLFPTVDQHWISLGLGYNDSVYFIDLATAYGFSVAKEIYSLPAISGKYDSETVNVTMTLKYVF